MSDAAPPRGDSARSLPRGAAGGPTSPLAFRAPLAPEGITAARLAELPRVLGTPRAVLSGVLGSAGAFAVAAIEASSGAAARRSGVTTLVVVEDAERAARFADDLRFALAAAGRPESDVAVLTAPDASPYAAVNPDRRAAMARVALLARLARPDDDGAPRVLVVDAPGLVRRLPPAEVMRAHTRVIVAEEELDRDALVAGLTIAGYLRVPVVEDPGTFAVRGAILDVWAPEAKAPARVELYGDLVTSIRPFDPDAQRTAEADRDVLLPRLVLPPAREAPLDPERTAKARARLVEAAEAVDYPTTKTRRLVEDATSGRAFFGADGYLPAYFDGLVPVLDHLPGLERVVLERPASLARAVQAELERATGDARALEGAPHFPVSALYLDTEALDAALAPLSVLTLERTAVGGAQEGAGLARFETTAGAREASVAALDHQDLVAALKGARAQKGRSALAPLRARLEDLREHGVATVLVARSELQADRLGELLAHGGTGVARIPAAEAFARPEGLAPRIAVGPLSEGTILPAEGLAFVVEEEIFGARSHRAKPRRREGKAHAFVEDLRTLAVGDYVVHAEHGIGKYHGLVHKAVGKATVDLLVVEYGGGDRLYLPVYRLNQISKYAGGEHGAPKLDRLGGTTFAKTKSRVKAAVREMADELLRLYAEREARVVAPMDPREDDYRAFEATFPFEETSDQARAIDEVQRDLDQSKPMDRLVCGDVGFGKTEVAIRAAFRVAMAGHQVAVLCPTTVLAQQHFRTFEARLAEHPVTVRSLSRFESKKEQDAVLKGLKDGSVDVVIGTHRLLSKDVRFKDLGLLVVDEEQRFGVTHKERMKQLRTEVHVLTLSATPIPRTLQMAVSGIRDLSLITTPPVDRRAVRTVVTRWDPDVVREAVTRELGRGGQVFYVYNRVEGLHERALRLQELVPEARIAVAHGQMTRGGRGGATREDGGSAGGALEETMLDFVEGRYDVLVATAIVESGLDIPRANTIVIDRADLFGLSQLYQLRGRVGRSKERAYCYLAVPNPSEMTDEARSRVEALERHTELGSGFKIASLDLELRGAGDILGGEQSGNVASVGLEMFCHLLEEAVSELRGDVVVHDVDTELSFDVETLLPEEYVSDVGVRLSLYKRLASAVDEAEVEDVGRELEERFGPPPPSTRQLLRASELKVELRRLRALGCDATASKVTLHLRDDTPLDVAKLTALVKRPRSPWKLTPDMRVVRRFDPPARDGLDAVRRTLDELLGTG